MKNVYTKNHQRMSNSVLAIRDQLIIVRRRNQPKTRFWQISISHKKHEKNCRSCKLAKYLLMVRGEKGGVLLNAAVAAHPLIIVHFYLFYLTDVEQSEKRRYDYQLQEAQ